MAVKEKKVELIELFYDLIYVYAISRLTMLIEEPENGIIPPSGFFLYLVICFVILQAWLYLTNYVNRYGRWQWYEYVLTAVNMTATVYMANTISPRWNEMSLTFNLAMLVMLLCVAMMYLIQTITKEQDTAAAKNSLTILTVDCLLYFAAFLASAFHAGELVIWLDVAAVLCGAFLPFFIRGRFDADIISFPHLAERFELITIITFGESIVGMTDFFDVRHFTMRPVLVFSVILLLFGCYVIQIHELCDHHRVDRALRLMISHYFIVISINLVTVAFKFLENPEASRPLTAGLMTTAMTLFLISIYSDSVYYHKRYQLTRSDVAIAAVSLIIGGALMFLLRDNVYGFLAGALVAAGGIFAMLLAKLMGKQMIYSTRFDR
ncbi:MAG: low temperature requirement protein A [Eubacteriaceae bacterium]|nr:low temperature requirement protein A [Eubacteriaceae bacterium]